MNSAIYSGTLRHRRFQPAKNAFSYSVCLYYLDLAELDAVFRWGFLAALNKPGLVSFRRKDYLGDPAVPLDQAVRDLVEQKTGRRPEGPIRFLTQIAYLGYCFNPVSFYYCFDKSGERVETIVSEITNTPWNERHAYVHSYADVKRVHPFAFDKAFHVSPFMDMNLGYEWTFSDPGEKLFVNMKNIAPGQDKHFFDATLIVNRHPLTPASFFLSLVAYPLMTFKTIALIYIQALKLWMKRVPFHPHTSKGVSV